MQHSLDRSHLHEPAEALHVRRVEPMRPFVWLRLGLEDLKRMRGESIGIGVIVALLGWLLMAAAWSASYLAPALLGGFLLVAPFIAIANYALSRQLERGERPDSDKAWRAWRSNKGSIALFGLVLVLAYIVWERLAAIVFALFYTGQPLQWSHFVSELFSGGYGDLLVAFFAVGAVLAGVVFALGIVSAPLLIDRPVDTITAMVTSLRCCARNPVAALLWAALIAALTAVGFATAMIGLVVIFPWLAHASWHAYRDLVEG